MREKTFLMLEKISIFGIGLKPSNSNLNWSARSDSKQSKCFFFKICCLHIYHIWYTYFCIMHVLSLFKWYHDNQLQPQNRVQCDTEVEIKVYSAQIGTITRQSPAQIHLISFLFEKYQTNATSAAFHFPFANYLTTHINIKRSKRTWQHFKLRW